MGKRLNTGAWWDMMRDNFWMFLALWVTQPTPTPPQPQDNIDFLFSDDVNIDNDLMEELYYMEEQLDDIQDDLDVIEEQIEDCEDVQDYDYLLEL